MSDDDIEYLPQGGARPGRRMGRYITRMVSISGYGVAWLSHYDPGPTYRLASTFEWDGQVTVTWELI